jgi:DNA invertase Pin-like site-specific DNA recombinase
LRHLHPQEQRRGPEQEFNSLDAQRSGEAYIASQKAEGWVCLPDKYNDGGFTGGNRNARGAAAAADIEAGKVDCVVVYKVDRLSRSLLDFARMMAVFEKHRVSFVSVTQQFNTTQSMGRLTLNILLSFAQFEREIISERTRDKIAASKRKGKWFGGKPILGYDLVAGKLVVNRDEAFRCARSSRSTSTPARCARPRRGGAAGMDDQGWTQKDGKCVGGLRSPTPTCTASSPTCRTWARSSTTTRSTTASRRPSSIRAVEAGGAILEANGRDRQRCPQRSQRPAQGACSLLQLRQPMAHVHDQVGQADLPLLRLPRRPEQLDITRARPNLCRRADRVLRGRPSPGAWPRP